MSHADARVGMPSIWKSSRRIRALHRVIREHLDEEEANQSSITGSAWSLGGGRRSMNSAGEGSTTIVLALPWRSIAGRCPRAVRASSAARASQVAFEREDVREPLVVGAGRVDGRARVESEFQDVEHDPERGVGDRPAARRAGHEPHACRPSSTIVGVCELSIRLPGAIRLAGVPIRPRGVGPAGDQVEVAHLVVEQEARARDHGLGAVAVLQGVRQRHGVAGGVEGREVGRVVASASRIGNGASEALGVARSPIERASSSA